MHLMETVAIFITRILTGRVVDGAVLVSPLFQTIVDAVFVGVDKTSSGNEVLDEGFDGLLLHVGEHLDDYPTATLQHPQHSRLLLLERAPAAAPFEPAPSSPAFLLPDCVALSLVTRDDVHLVALYGSC